MKPLLVVFFVYFFLILISYLLPNPKTHIRSPTKEKPAFAETKVTFQRTKNHASSIRRFASQKGFSSRYAFLIDMNLSSGKNRFFIYDFVKDTIVASGLVAHGSCNTRFLYEPQFSNTPQCGCTSIGRYKVGEANEGRFGKAFKLYGLDSTNANAFQRNIVLHGYKDIPDNEVYPNPIPNSLGCPMVSYSFLDKASRILKSERRPILLRVYQ